MADDKKGRDKQARDAKRRQQERDIAEARERWEEPEPTIDAAELDDVEADLEPLEFPAAGAEIVDAVGTHEVESEERTYTIEELIPDTETETFDAPTAVRARIQRPTVAAAMKRIVEASQQFQNTDLRGSQRDAYEKTFRELGAIDADDDDQGIQVVRDWIVERIREKESLPGSRAVRRRAAKFCRANGYEVRNSEWLGV